MIQDLVLKENYISSEKLSKFSNIVFAENINKDYLFSSDERVEIIKESLFKDLKFNKKKFIYLISPTKIHRSFYSDLIGVLRYKKISFFQLRIKKENFKSLIDIRGVKDHYRVIKKINKDDSKKIVIDLSESFLGRFYNLFIRKNKIFMSYFILKFMTHRTINRQTNI